MKEILSEAIDRALKLGAEFVDIRVENNTGTNVTVLDGKTKQIVSPRDIGAGIRSFIRGGWGFSCTNKLSKKALKEAVESSVKMAKTAEKKAKVRFAIEEGRAIEARASVKAKLKLEDVPIEEKVKLALNIDKSARTYDKRISSTSVLFHDFVGELTIANSFGTYLEIPQSWMITACRAYAQENGIRQWGLEARAGVGGFEIVEKQKAFEVGEVAATKAVRLLTSKSAPAGKFPCIFDQRLSGIFIHEAFGHACEADAVLAGASVLEGKMGERVGSQLVTVVDDPSMEGTFGYFPFDWEGTPARKRTLVEKGILKEFIHNLETSSRMKLPANGGARAETYQDTPIVRMSNTYIAPGDWKFEEILKDMGKGLYAKGAQYGYVDPAKGQFMFKCEEVYEIVNGEIGTLYRDVSLSGLTLEVLANTDAIGNDFVIGDPGYCGKGGQSARTTDGGPHIRVKEVVVGGLV